MQNLTPTASDLVFQPRKMPKLLTKYELLLMADEIDFLRAFIAWMVREFNDPEYILELAVLYEVGRRLRDKLEEPKDRKITLRPHEALSLKRMLWIPALSDPEQNRIRNKIHGDIDQLTPGIY